MVNTVIYVATVIYIFIAPDQGLYTLVFFGPKPSLLNTLQGMNPYMVRYKAELWRPFTALFLTTGFQ